MAKPPGNPVTDEHLELFDGYVKKWQRLLNLDDWRIERGPKRPKGVMASVKCFDGDQLAVYSVGQHFGSTPVTPEELESTALHELLHIRLRKFKVDQSYTNEHEIVHVFERLLMKGTT